MSLSKYGFNSDPGKIAEDDEFYKIFHFTHSSRLEEILSEESGGILARRALPEAEYLAEFSGFYQTEGFLEPFPQWLFPSPYFSDVGLSLVERYIGDVLLEINVPKHFDELYVAEFAHALEIKHTLQMGGPALWMDYSDELDSRLGALSLMPLSTYRGQYLAPVVKILRRGAGIAVPGKYIRVSDVQPFSNTPPNGPYRYLRKQFSLRDELIEQLDQIDKLVYAVARYKSLEKVYPRQFPDLVKACQTDKYRLCYPKYRYNLSPELLHSEKFQVDEARDECLIKFQKSKTAIDAFQSVFRRPRLSFNGQCIECNLRVPNWCR